MPKWSVNVEIEADTAFAAINRLMWDRDESRVREITVYALPGEND